MNIAVTKRRDSGRFQYWQNRDFQPGKIQANPSVRKETETQWWNMSEHSAERCGHGRCGSKQRTEQGCADSAGVSSPEARARRPHPVRLQGLAACQLPDVHLEAGVMTSNLWGKASCPPSNTMYTLGALWPPGL